MDDDDFGDLYNDLGPEEAPSSSAVRGQQDTLSANKPLGNGIGSTDISEDKGEEQDVADANYLEDEDESELYSQLYGRPLATTSQSQAPSTSVTDLSVHESPPRASLSAPMVPPSSSNLLETGASAVAGIPSVMPGSEGGLSIPDLNEAEEALKAIPGIITDAPREVVSPFEGQAVPTFVSAGETAVRVEVVQNEEDSEDDDDLQIVLNEAPLPRSAPNLGNAREGSPADSDDEDDLVIVGVDQPPSNEEWQLSQEQGLQEEGLPREVLQSGVPGPDEASLPLLGTTAPPARMSYGAGQAGPGAQIISPHMKYVRPGAVQADGENPSALPTGTHPGQPPGQKGFYGAVAAGWGISTGPEFLLPPTKTIFEINLDSLDDKSWRRPGIDLSNFFNFGLTEASWKDYCRQLAQLRLEATMQSKIRVYESGRTEQDYDPELPQELANAPGSTRRTTGLQMEGSGTERRPSFETRRPRLRDADVIIYIKVEGVGDEEKEEMPVATEAAQLPPATARGTVKAPTSPSPPADVPVQDKLQGKLEKTPVASSSGPAKDEADARQPKRPGSAPMQKPRPDPGQHFPPAFMNQGPIGRGEWVEGWDGPVAMQGRHGPFPRGPMRELPHLPPFELRPPHDYAEYPPGGFDGRGASMRHGHGGDFRRPFRDPPGYAEADRRISPSRNRPPAPQEVTYPQRAQGRGHDDGDHLELPGSLKDASSSEEWDEVPTHKRPPLLPPPPPLASPPRRNKRLQRESTEWDEEDANVAGKRARHFVMDSGDSADEPPAGTVAAKRYSSPHRGRNAAPSPDSEARVREPGSSKFRQQRRTAADGLVRSPDTHRGRVREEARPSQKSSRRKLSRSPNSSEWDEEARVESKSQRQREANMSSRPVERIDRSFDFDVRREADRRREADVRKESGSQSRNRKGQVAYAETPGPRSRDLEEAKHGRERAKDRDSSRQRSSRYAADDPELKRVRHEAPKSSTGGARMESGVARDERERSHIVGPRDLPSQRPQDSRGSGKHSVHPDSVRHHRQSGEHQADLRSRAQTMRRGEAGDRSHAEERQEKHHAHQKERQPPQMKGNEARGKDAKLASDDQPYGPKRSVRREPQQVRSSGEASRKKAVVEEEPSAPYPAGMGADELAKLERRARKFGVDVNLQAAEESVGVNRKKSRRDEVNSRKQKHNGNRDVVHAETAGWRGEGNIMDKKPGGSHPKDSARDELRSRKGGDRQKLRLKDRLENPDQLANQHPRADRDDEHEQDKERPTRKRRWA